MARFTISIDLKGLRESVVAKLVEKLKAEQPTMGISFSKVPEPPSSRAERLSAALSDFEGAKDDALSVVQELRDELQNWLDGLSGTNLESSSKADELQEAIDSLESLESDIESVDVPSDGDVSFPGMY